MSYIVNFEIPDEWWQGVSHVPGERERARNRASVKRYSRMVWSEAEKSGRAWKAERFCLSLAVQAESEEEFAGDAEEALKSLVDAGSRDGGGVGLWDDDDSSHRLMTCYFRLPSGLGRGRRRVQAGIWEVGKYFDPLHALAASVSKAWAQVPVWKRCPDWKGRVVEWAFPSSLWLTSNYTDTDIACREAERKIGGWGAAGMRERLMPSLLPFAPSPSRSGKTSHPCRRTGAPCWLKCATPPPDRIFAPIPTMPDIRRSKYWKPERGRARSLPSHRAAFRF